MKDSLHFQLTQSFNPFSHTHYLIALTTRVIFSDPFSA